MQKSIKKVLMSHYKCYFKHFSNAGQIINGDFFNFFHTLLSLIFLISRTKNSIAVVVCTRDMSYLFQPENFLSNFLFIFFLVQDSRKKSSLAEEQLRDMINKK